MKIQRVYKKYSIDDIKQDSFILWESLVSLNDTWLLWIPYKVGNVFFHILPKTNNQDITSIISFYNKKENSLKETISKILELWDIIFDIEFNYSILYKVKDEEFKEYVHPVRQSQLLQEELYKTVNIISKKLGVNSLFTLVFSEKVKHLEKMYSWKFQILSENELTSKLYNLNFLFSKNERDRNNVRIELFEKVVEQLINTDRYVKLSNEIWREKVEERLLYEVSIILQDRYIEYFLNYIIITQYLRKEKIVFFLKWSAVWSLLLYLLWISNINPIRHNIPFERFLNKWKIADIDIDIPSSKREYIIQSLNKIFSSFWYEVLLILNKSSNNFDKFTEHPSGILIEETKYIEERIPLQVSERENLILRTSQLYDSSSTPVLEKYWYLKYDLLRSQVLEELQDKINKKWLDFYSILNTWESLTWSSNYLDLILKWDFFQINSVFAKDLVKRVNPTSYFDLVKIIACNRPALVRLYWVEYLSEQLRLSSWISLKDKKIESIINSSQSWRVILFQDQVIDLLLSVLPQVDYSSVIKLVKARGDILWKYKDIFITECNKRIDNLNYSKELWSMIENFDQYWLNKAHSSSYWLITYLQLYVASLD